MDYIPFASTITNIVTLIAKTALSIMSKYYSSTYIKFESSTFVKHLNQKDIASCILLSIPFLNICVALRRDAIQHRKNQKEGAEKLHETIEKKRILISTTQKKNKKEESLDLNSISIEEIKKLSKEQLYEMFPTHTDKKRQKTIKKIELLNINVLNQILPKMLHGY